MIFKTTALDNCHTASGLVVVIDVLRAFSNAAYAFSRGAKQILLVSSVEEALYLKHAIPDSLAMGEVGGIPPAGFDFGNSPTEMVKQDVLNRTLIQRTGAGTQGAVRAINAETLFAASFVVAGATVRKIQQLLPPQVTFVITGGFENDEDVACAEYLQELLNGRTPDRSRYKERVYRSRDALQHLDPHQTAFPLADLDYCSRIDEFEFTMPILRENGRLIMHADKP